jgi:DNA replication protein DnaC
MAEWVCACVTRPRVQPAEAIGLVGRLASLSLAGVEADRLKAGTWQSIQGWVQGFPDTARDGSVEGLLLIGPVGTGKTGLMVGVLDAARLACVDALFVREVDIVRQVRATYDGVGSETRVIERFEKVPLLGIDDVGKAYVPQKQNGQDGLQWLASILYTIIDERLTRGRPTLVSTNLDDAALLRRLGDALVDRLDTFWRVDFSGESRR